MRLPTIWEAMIITGIALLVWTIGGWVVGANARSRCTYYSDGREPRCLTTSDTGKEQYKRDTQRPRGSWASRQTQQWRDNAKKRGAAAWQNNGTPSSVGTISPFVPGSVEDTAWRAERKRRGIQ